MLRFAHKARPRRFPGSAGPGTGPEARLKKIRRVVTALFRHERIESTFAKCDEAKGYAERLIQIAIKNGDQHRETMEMADYWLEEKDLVHKLFKVFVPRYQAKYHTDSFTQMWRLPSKLPGDGKPMSILELKGNPWPSVQPKIRNTKYLLTNVLLDGLRTDYKQQKRALSTEQQIKEQTIDTPSNVQDEYEKNMQDSQKTIEQQKVETERAT